MMNCAPDIAESSPLIAVRLPDSSPALPRHSGASTFLGISVSAFSFRKPHQQLNRSTSLQSPRLPWIRLMITTMTAITRRRWIRPPPTWPRKPRSQSTTKITTIVQSMMFLSIELAAIATQRLDSIKQKIEICAPLNALCSHLPSPNSRSPALSSSLFASVRCDPISKHRLAPVETSCWCAGCSAYWQSL